MSAHRYWRILNTATRYFSIAEIELREYEGGDNVAVGGVAFSSSILNATAPPENAVDGDVGTEWHSGDGGAGNNWWAYDFGAGNEREITHMLFTQRLSNADWSPNTWRTDVSDDGVVWTSVRLSGGTYPPGIPVLSSVRKLLPGEFTNRMIDFSANRCAGRQMYGGVPGAPTIDPSEAPWHLRPAVLRSADMTFGGLFKLDGTTTSLGDPAPRRVRLYHQFSGRPIAEMVTGEDGLFSFTHIEEGPWTVIGIDDTGAQNGVIYSHVKAVPMY